MKRKRKILLVCVLMLMLAGCAPAFRQQEADSRESREQLNTQEYDPQRLQEKPEDENPSLDEKPKEEEELPK